MPLNLDDAFVRRFRLSEATYVASPALPELEDFAAALAPVWESRILTNNGRASVELEGRLSEMFDGEPVNLTCNGTIALMLALRAFGVDGGEVITTPFTFPATVHAIDWLGLEPVFADIDPGTLCLDPEAVERALTKRTRAILPVHVYGTPCDVDAFAEISERTGLPVIYDAAHAMGVRMRGKPLVAYGDAATLSFHATKLFTTAEGGAVVTRAAEMKQMVYLMRNFGIADYDVVLGSGINGKMNEIQATLGLLNLPGLAAEIAARKRVAGLYDRALAGVPGLHKPEAVDGHEPNYSYYPLRVDAAEFGASRDELIQALRQLNIVARSYFYPLANRFPCYDDRLSAAPANLPVAERVAQEILCLPMYGALAPGSAAAIGRALLAVHEECVAS